MMGKCTPHTSDALGIGEAGIVGIRYSLVFSRERNPPSEEDLLCNGYPDLQKQRLCQVHANCAYSVQSVRYEFPSPPPPTNHGLHVPNQGRQEPPNMGRRRSL